MFESRGQAPAWEGRLADHFAQELGKPGAAERVPSLNIVPNHELCDGQLVRFRCLVQDMFDPEFYLGQYRVRSLADGGVAERTGRYRDLVSCGPREELLPPGDGDTRDRLSYYCVSVPGEAAWVADHHRVQGGAGAAGPSGTKTNPLKRGLEPEEADGMDTAEPEVAGPQEAELKKAKPEGQKPTAAAKRPALGLNLPLPSATGKAAIVKLYDIVEGDIKLNDIIEVVGIVSLDPSLAGGLGEEEDGMAFSSSPALPPPSLVPRLHALTYKVLPHSNPLPLPPTGPTEAAQARSELLAILTEALLGDVLAAEFLLCHLVSGVYLRRDVLVLGKFSLNLHNMTPHDQLPRRLATVLSLLTTASHLLPLSRHTLDTTAFLPKKDFEANRLVSGVLQLARGTNLVVDETAMTDGQLAPQGLANLTALGNLITWQKAEYDFKYQKMEYDMDIPCLVLSEGRSMLPSDVQLMLKVMIMMFLTRPLTRPPQPDCEASPDVVSTKYSGIGSYLTTALLTRLRTYITQCREATFSLTEEMMTEVQEDFVRLRQAAGGMTVEDFHLLLVLARLLAKSAGRGSLQPEDWERAKELEAGRKARVAALAPRAGANFANGVPMHL
jgi:hypothetical protein